MKEKLIACLDRLQRLDIQPSLGNMEKLLATLYDLRDIFNELNATEEKDGEETSDLQ